LQHGVLNKYSSIKPHSKDNIVFFYTFAKVGKIGFPALKLIGGTMEVHV